MNKHLKTFAAEVFPVNRHGIIVSPVDGYENIEEELQKFAKMIIDKCADICYDSGQSETNKCAWRIEAHFED
jgi:hypothetical protein